MLNEIRSILFPFWFVWWARENHTNQNETLSTNFYVDFQIHINFRCCEYDYLNLNTDSFCWITSNEFGRPIRNRKKSNKSLTIFDWSEGRTQWHIWNKQTPKLLGGDRQRFGRESEFQWRSASNLAHSENNRISFRDFLLKIRIEKVCFRVCSLKVKCWSYRIANVSSHHCVH